MCKNNFIKWIIVNRLLWHLKSFISDTYMLRYGKSCHGVYGDAYSTISSAKAACNQDDDCKLIVDRTCNGRNFNACKGPIIDSSIESCVWNKNKGISDS